jgi:hypothetical protein
MNPRYASEHAMFASAQLLRKWREQQPSNQGYHDWSVMGEVGRLLDGGGPASDLIFVPEYETLLDCVLNGTHTAVVKILPSVPPCFFQTARRRGGGRGNTEMFLFEKQSWENYRSSPFRKSGTGMSKVHTMTRFSETACHRQNVPL